MKFRSFAAVFALVGLAAGPVLAQAPAPAPAAAPAAPAAAPVTAFTEPVLRLAREVVEASGLSKTFDVALPDIALRIRQGFANRPEIAKDMDDTLVALLPEIRTRRGEMIERSARTIASAFTEAELRDLVTFFNSATGKKYVGAQQGLINQVFQFLEPWMQQTSEFFLARLREEMRKKGHTL